MRGTTLLVAIAVAAPVLFSWRTAHTDEEAGESEATLQAADHLGADRYALVIGIDDYADDGIPDLHNRENDARGVLSVLGDPLVGGVPEANVQSLLGTEATTAKIRKALERLASVPKEATIFVYFAGHGAMKGEGAYWVTQDAKEKDLPGTAVAAEDVKRLLAGIPAERILLMMENRHAEGLVGKRGARVDHPELLARYQGEGYATLAAADTAEETITSEEIARSVLTHHLIEGLLGEADGDEDGAIDLGELVTHVGRRVRVEARKRSGLERPVADLEGVPDPSLFLLAIEPEGLLESLLDDEPAQILRRLRLAALATMLGEGRITGEQARVGRFLLGALPQGFRDHELEQRTMFVDLAEGRLGPEHVADALAAIRRPDRKTLIVPDQFQTIQSAIDAAIAGDTVFVKVGTYDEHLVLKSGVCLRGEGRERTVIRMVPGEKEILLAQDCVWAVIEGLQLDGTGGTKLEDWSPDGIHMVRSTVRVSECLVHSCVGCGLYAGGAGNRPYVTECTFEKNTQDGLCVSEADGGDIVDCILRSNGALGIQIRDSRGTINVRACQCEVDKQAGIGVSGGSTAVLEGNDCQRNAGHGIIAWDAKTSVTLVDNTCSRNEVIGIFVVQGATVVATGNECNRNRESGFVVSGAGTEATLVKNRCRGHDLRGEGNFGGIVFHDGARGEATSNSCEENVRGILVTGSGTKVRLRGNTCRKNLTSGIEFSRAAPGHATGNTCRDNEYGVLVSNSEATLEDNTILRNTMDGILINGLGIGHVSGNRCLENEKAGIHVVDPGTRADLVKNTCTSNGSHGILFARRASGTADGNECSENKAFGIAATDSGTRPVFRRNRCTNNGRAGIGKEEGAAPVIESNNVQSGNGK